MRPLIFDIGPFTVTGMGLMLLASLLTGAWLFAVQLKRRGMDPEHAWDMLVWVALAGVAGAKAYFVALHWPAFLADPVAVALSPMGLVWYGGLLGGTLAFWWQSRRRGLPVLGALDAVAPAAALAYGVGRIGCFLVGENYGRATESWVGIAFPEGNPPSTAGYLRSMGAEVPLGLPDAAVLAVHPTQLYELGAAVVIFAVLWRLAAGRLGAGKLFGVFSVLYGLQRFLIEFVRVKDDRFVVGLTTSQVASMVLIGIGVMLWTRRSAPASDAGAAGSGRAKAGSYAA